MGARRLQGAVTSFPGLCRRGAAGSAACLHGETRAALGQARAKVGPQNLLSTWQGPSKALKLSAPTSSKRKSKDKAEIPK